MRMQNSQRLGVLAAAIVAILVLLTLSIRAQQSPGFDASQLTVPAGTVAAQSALVGATGPVDVWIGLIDPSVARAAGRNARRGGGRLNPGQQAAYARELDGKQAALLAEVGRRGGRELARVNKGHNAVAVTIDASQLGAIAAWPGVASIRRVRNYKLDLSETVPYIGASAVQASGVDGTGVKVAVLDSGVDYTHRNLGGSGLLADYVAAYGAGPADPKNTTRDGLFPTSKVVDGFDFVGEAWTGQAGSPPPAEDPDPIDFEGHGTHVTDIIAGHSLDGTHQGVAPGASIVALKVCSSLTTACSGVALIRAMDFALDPNGDGDLSDAVDVINMSLGSDYGQEQDDLSQASQDAVEFGVVVVAAAGNAGNRPYIVDSPSIAPGVISVAQTQVPSASTTPLIINSPPSIAGQYANTAGLSFAPVTADVTGGVAYVGRGCPAGSITPTSPADPYLANPAGKIALIDRGACNVSLKIDRAAHAGAIGTLIGLVAPGDPVTFAFGGGTLFVPSLVIPQSTSTLIKVNISAPVNATLSHSGAIALVGSLVASSGRGPSYSHNAIKPEIGAPGASVSAAVGTGTGETAFGGTSGATPMIAGSAALLIQAYPNRSALEIKALLMNTATTNVFVNPATLPGVLAPITSIGGGEVRVDKALATTTAAWDKQTEIAGLSFGYEAVADAAHSTRHVTVRNYSNKQRTYDVQASFRYANDASSGAVTIDVPSKVTVAPDGEHSVPVKIDIDPGRLPIWNLNGGNQGGNGSLLQGVEFDGYLTISDGHDTVHVPWHVLPHRAAGVVAHTKNVKLGKDGSGTVEFGNGGTLDGVVELFSLTGTSDRIPRKQLPEPGDNFAVVDLAAVGVRSVPIGSQTLVQFGITTFGERSHPNYPAEFDIYIDANRDGEADYVIFNSENGGFGVSGQNVVSVFNLATGSVVTRFFAVADLDSANMIFTALPSDLGLTPGTTFDFAVVAGDNYFTGNITDAIVGMTYTLDTPRFATGGVLTAGVLAGGTGSLTIQSVPGGDVASPSQKGLLLLYRDAVPGKEADTILID